MLALVLTSETTKRSVLLLFRKVAIHQPVTSTTAAGKLNRDDVFLGKKHPALGKKIQSSK